MEDYTGKIFGGCLVLKKIGEGGMGVVYEAEQSSLARNVAIKFLAAHLTNNEAFVSRFLREARSAAGINHPHVLEVYDVGREGNIIYMITELVRGKTLKQIIKERGKLPEDEALSIIQDIASALIEAEQKGIVHRDLKPDNVMVTGNNVVKVMDFGLAKNVADVTQGLTQTGAVLGTPQYMSPEQIKGGNVDIQSDIYSLGLILFYLVTGRKAFDGDTPVQICHDQVYSQIPHPQKINPGLSQPVCSLIIKMTKKDKKERFKSPREIVEAIKLLKKDVRAFSGIYKKEKIEATILAPQGRNTTLYFVAGAVIALFVLGGTFFVLKGRGPKLKSPAGTISAGQGEKIVLRWDSQGKVTFLNKFGQECFGYRSDEILGRDIMGTIVPKTESSGRDLENLIGDIEKNPENYRDNVNENICSSGELIWVQWKNEPIFGQDGHITEILSLGVVIKDPQRIKQEIAKKKTITPKIIVDE